MENPCPFTAATRPRFGLGLLLDLDKMKVLNVMPGGASDGIIEVGDILFSINRTILVEIPKEEVVSLTRGEVGSCAEITLYRGNSNAVSTVKVLRINPEHFEVDSKRRVDMGFHRRSDDKIKEIFDQHTVDGRHLSKGRIVTALKQFDPIYDICNDDLENEAALIEKFDRDGDKQIDYDEFAFAVKCSNLDRKINQFVDVTVLSQILSDALPRKPGSNELIAPDAWTMIHIDAMKSAFLHGLDRVLMDLRMNSGKSGTFDVENPGKPLVVGGLDAFHEGLSNLVGYPHLDFLKAMEREHCVGDHATKKFQTTNTNIETTPMAEWRFVTSEDPVNAGHMIKGRRRISVQQMMLNPETKEADLTDHEVIALNLYSGPMYRVYNSILRKYPAEVYEAFKADVFSTTIHVLVSAVQKLARVTRMESNTELYRGLGFDSELPDCFFKLDPFGCSGFTECGFMSTTLKKEVAVEQYSKVNDGNPSPKLLVIRTSSVDRGASIKRFSQYPDEDEFLFVPCSFLEMTLQPFIESWNGKPVQGYHVTVNINLKTLTVENLLKEKKGFHITAFNHLIMDVETELKNELSRLNPQARLENDKTRDENHTVEGFLDCVLQNCRNVQNQHSTKPPRDFVTHEQLRPIVLEMLEVRTMAISKFHEWFENTESSFLRFRWNSPLRTAHRRYLSFLELELQAARDSASPKTSEARLELAAKICKLKGLISSNVHERNELGETPLMQGAAAGCARQALRLLVCAGADVNASRPDGVNAMWLAAQFGHDDCIRELHANNADVNKSANDGATPVYIAAQSGYLRCIQVLCELNADPLLRDKKAQSPLDQAMTNKRVDCIAFLESWESSEPGQFNTIGSDSTIRRSISKTRHMPGLSKKLIVNSGDVSDIDGFFALAAYAKSGADVLFVMSYPAYVAEVEEDPEYASVNLGLGYKYPASKMIERDERNEMSEGKKSKYGRFLQRYDRKDCNQAVKRALTDLAFAMASNMWSDLGATGKLVFCIGKCNAINPFSARVIKNELLIYSELFDEPASLQPFEPVEGCFYSRNGDPLDFQFEDYSEIRIDFCGSMSFWDESWDRNMRREEVAPKIKAAFVMGGVLTDKAPVTLPPIEGVLNRFSSATMNQLYNPVASVRFLSFLHQFKIDTFVVSNNVVDRLGSTTEVVPIKEIASLFLKANDIHCDLLDKSSGLYYESSYKPAPKPFDFYAALLVCEHMRDSQDLVKKACIAKLYFGSLFGTAFVSQKETWAEAKHEYVGVVSGMKERLETARARAKEMEEVKKMGNETGLAVYNVSFDLDQEKWQLSVQAGGP